VNNEEQVMIQRKASAPNKIIFCTVCDDNYFPGACVMLYSLRKNFKSLPSCDVKVIYNDIIAPLSKKNRDYLKKIIPNIQFDNTPNLPYTDVATKVEDHRPAFLTLEAFKEYKYDKMVFIDADAYCFRDFSFLLSLDAGFLAARHYVKLNESVLNNLPVNLPLSAERWNSLEINTGFMIVDNKYLNPMVYNKLISMVPKGKTFLADQPIINRYFGRQLNTHLFKLPPMYNFIFPHSKLFMKYIQNIKILHFCGQGKDRIMPWYSNANQDSLINKVWKNTAQEMIGKYGSYGTIQESLHGEQGRVLLAGPWIGELGWELFHWQGYIRRLSKQVDRTIVIGRPDHKGLYDDFCDEYIEHDPGSTNTDCWKCNGGDPGKHFRDTIEHTSYRSGEFNMGFRKLSNTWKPSKEFSKQDFIKYGTFKEDCKHDILLHARSTPKNGSGKHNWDIEKWKLLVNSFSNLSIASIGTSTGAYHVEGTKDLRNIPLVELFDVMASSRLIIGPSSGPMHLASLCGLPQLVWSGDGSTKIRYNKLWNPFGVPVRYYGDEGHQPKFESICKILRVEMSWLFEDEE